MKKWILRTLVFVVVLIGLFLAALNLLSGTGESQKRALEQAVSGVFQGQASLGKLTKFTIFPHLTIAAQELVVASAERGNIAADEAEISFGFFDILFSRRTIEKFHLANISVSGAGYLPQPLSIIQADILPGPIDKPETARFEARGTYAGQPLTVTFDMESIPDTPPRYRFREENAFMIDISGIQVSGIFSPHFAAGTEFRQMKVLGPKNSVVCEVAPEKMMAASVFFHSLITNPKAVCEKQ